MDTYDIFNLCAHMKSDIAILEKKFNLFSKVTNYLNSNVINGLSFSSIDTHNYQVEALSTNLSWHLDYWASSDIKKLTNRLKVGIHLWEEFPNVYIKHFALKSKRLLKYDVVSQHSSIYEILSIDTSQPLSNEVLKNLVYQKPKISHISRQILSGKKVNKKGVTFGHLYFTEKEWILINLLLQLKCVKEIASIQCCSDALVRRRINSIKDKLNCSHQPLSSLFFNLKSQGIISCHPPFIMSP